jgi:hypothetical protein
MLEKFEGEMSPQDHRNGEEENSDLDYREVVDTILGEGRMTIDRSDRKGYTLEARKMLDGTTEEEVITAITEQADFSESFVSYVSDRNEEGQPVSTFTTAKERSIGVARSVYLTVKKDPGKDIQIKANVNLLHLDDQDPTIEVLLYASRIDFNDFERAHDDGRCLICEGWGCWECGFSGGY